MRMWSLRFSSKEIIIFHVWSFWKRKWGWRGTLYWTYSRLPPHLTLPEVNRRDLKRFWDSLPGKAVRSSQGRTGGLGGRFPEVPVPPHLCKNKHWQLVNRKTRGSDSPITTPYYLLRGSWSASLNSYTVVTIYIQPRCNWNYTAISDTYSCDLLLKFLVCKQSSRI